MGNGVGDLNIKAECGLLIQTYEVHDKWFYSTSIPSYTAENLGEDYKKWNFNNPITLPQSFKMTFKGKFTDWSTMLSSMIGESIDKFYYSGFDSMGVLHCISRNNARAVLTRDNHTKSMNTEYTITITYDGTDMIVSDGTYSVTTTNSEYDKEKWLGMLVGKAQVFSLFQIDKL